MRTPVEPPTQDPTGTVPTPGVANGPWEEIGTPLVVDTSLAKAWVERIPAGATRPLHTHRDPWLTVVISGGRADVLGPDGQRLDTVELTTGQVKLNALPNGRPVRHAMHNTGDSELVLVAVQLPSQAGGSSGTGPGDGEGRP